MEQHEDELLHSLEETGMEMVLRNATNLTHAEKLGLWALRTLPQWVLNSPVNPWAKDHTNPAPPKQTFREYYRKKKS